MKFWWMVELDRENPEVKRIFDTLHSKEPHLGIRVLVSAYADSFKLVPIEHDEVDS